MVLPILLYFILLFVSAAVTLVMSAGTWRYRRIFAARVFFWLVVTVTIWSLVTGFASLRWPVGVAEFWFRMKFFPVAFAGPLFLVFIFQHTSWAAKLPRERLAALFVIPVLTQVVVWTNNLHGLVYRDLTFLQADGFTLVNSWDPGQWFWVHTIYHYTLVGVGLILIFFTIQRPEEPYRSQAWYLFLGSIFGIGANVITTFELGLAFDISPVGFTFNVFDLELVAFAKPLYRFRFNSSIEGS